MVEMASVKYKELLLKRIQVMANAYVGRSVRFDVDSFIDPMLDRICLSIKARVWGRDVHKDILETITYPETWWDAFKEQWFPKFLKKRFPVNLITKKVTINFTHICPHLNTEVEGIHLSFLAYGKPYVGGWM